MKIDPPARPYAYHRSTRDYLPPPTLYQRTEFRVAYSLGSLVAVIGSALLRPVRKLLR